MLIDNKKENKALNITTVWDFIDKFSGNDSGQKGSLDIVTGYFMIHTLAKLHDAIPVENDFRIISSEMVGDDYCKDMIVDLLSDSLDIDKMGMINEDVPKAIAFLERDTVQMRAEIPDFCHAKAYLFTNANSANQSYYITGSSNLTPAGIGLKRVPNVELNIAKRLGAEELEYQELKDWYEDIWSNARTEVPEDSENKKSPKIPVKEYFIRKIREYFRTYSPEEIYYKILFELFNADLDLEGGIEHQKDMSLLQTSVIWKTLFNYQQKGVISLIKMLRKYNGAILADAVGLGKTFSALAVIKYFQTQNYTTVLLCPKKLESNWNQYLKGANSRFEKDEFDYQVRFHTDCQNSRLQDSYPTYKLDYLQTRKKLLIVIDESHNLRNEKSGRFKTLMEELVKTREGVEGRDVKILMLSATPINTGLNDVKGQFSLIAHGADDAFNNPEFEVESLKNTFADAQRKYTTWCDDENRTIGSFISKLPQKFFNLTDKLIVARTRSLIENKLGEDLGFPKKDKPENVYQGVDHFGKYTKADEIYAAFDQLALTAYQPSMFLHESRKDARKEAASDWDDDINRERFLVKMMAILFMKRLESSWFSCMSTIKKVLDVHVDTLEKVVAYKQDGTDSIIRHGVEIDEEEELEIENVGRRQIKVSDIQNLGGFEKGLRHDVNLLKDIYSNIEDFERKYRSGQEKDLKLEELVRILNDKKKKENKKVVIFTAYSDTAQFLFDELSARGFRHLASASGQDIFSTGQHSKKNFTEVLQSFAPYSKLYKELEWSDLYDEARLDRAVYFSDEKDRWEVPYELWLKLVRQHRPKYALLYDDNIDILIATDCLSEGQNLQDADMQINYDIHWNPVRLIQRFGRIDRIGSPNKLISCVNFWPAKSFEEYLDLETRIQNRMSLMKIIDTETVEIDTNFEEMIKDNPIQDKNAERLLEQLTTNSISDIESPRTLSLKDFSFETYRQDLVDYYSKQNEFYRRMPNGVFSGFVNSSKQYPDKPESLVALVGYPKKPEGKKEHHYTELYVMCQPVDAHEAATFQEVNKADVLEFLRQNKSNDRFVPAWITENDTERVARLSDVLKTWMQKKAPQQAMLNIKDKLKRKIISSAPTVDKKNQLLEEKFQIQNFDLIVWEYVTRNGGNADGYSRILNKDNVQVSKEIATESQTNSMAAGISDDVVKLSYQPPYQSFFMPPSLHLVYDRVTKVLTYEYKSFSKRSYAMPDSMIAEFKQFFEDKNNLLYIFDGEKDGPERRMGAHWVNDYLEIEWAGHERHIQLRIDSEIGQLCNRAVHSASEVH